MLLFLHSIGVSICRFGNASIKRIVDWLDSADEVSATHSVLDVGCGNGMTLVALAKRGYQNLFGVDYSPHAIELARRVSADKNLQIIYEVK